MKKKSRHIITFFVPLWLDLELKEMKKKGTNISFFIREAIIKELKKGENSIDLIEEKFTEEEKIKRDKTRIEEEKEFIRRHLKTISSFAEVRAEALKRDIRTNTLTYDDYLSLIEEVKKNKK